MRRQLSRVSTGPVTAAPLVVLGVGLAVIIWSLLPGGGILQSFELKTIDARFWARENTQPTSNIVTVSVDDRSLSDDDLGSWPWPRDNFAKIVDYLTDAGARAIVFDVLFRDPDVDDPASDRRFIEAVRESGRVYLAAASFAENEAQEPLDAENAAICTLPGAQVQHGGGLDAFADLPVAGDLVLPFDGLRQAAKGLGLVDIPADADGVTREYLPVFRQDGKLCPSLALAVAVDVLQAPTENVVVHVGSHIDLAGNARIPIDRSGMMVINFAGDANSFRRYSAVDIIDDSDGIDPAAFRGKVVVVAVTASGLHDVHPTPFAGAAKGVEIHANALNTMLNRQFLRLQRPECALLSTLAGLIVISLLAIRASYVLYVLGSLACIVVYNYIAVSLFSAHGLIIPMFVPTVTMVSGLLAASLYMIVAQQRRQYALIDALGRFLPPEVTDQLTTNQAEVAISGERRTITVLFADLRDFTSASARMGAEQTVTLLSRYFELMHEIVFEFDATLDKFIGDEIMVFFNAPADQPYHAHTAVACALKMQQSIEAYQDEWAFHGMPDLRAGIGISTGRAVVGCIGSGTRMQYTAIGEHVNLANRLQALSKEVGARIVISQPTYELVANSFECRDLGAHALPGVEGERRVYEVIGPIS